MDTETVDQAVETQTLKVGDWPGSTLKNVLHGPSGSAKCVSNSWK